MMKPRIRNFKKLISNKRKPLRGISLALETFEERLTPYSASGNLWPNAQLITVSFMPDGTSLNGKTSNLFATFNAKFGAAATWQNVFKEAAQVWAAQTNINFNFVTDNGAASGSGSNQQGDPGFGDIRIGGYNFGTTTLGQAYMPPAVNNYSIAGDIAINTGQTFNIGTTYDLFTVATHEIGHALGLNHGAVGSVMASAYPGTLTGLTTDDISGIKAIYSAGAVRAKDTYDATAANETFATATLISSTINSTTKAAVINNLQLSTSTDVDWYKFVIPSGSATTLKVKAVATGISMLNPKIEIYDSTNVAKASGNGGAYGSIASASFTGQAASQTWYVKVSSADAKAAFKTGKYSLILNMGTGADPVVSYTTTTKANSSPLTSGGGVAAGDGQESQVNLTGTQLNAAMTISSSASNVTVPTGKPQIAMDATGNYVVVWSSMGEDGSGWGIFAQRYDAKGIPQGGTFQVNTTTASDQLDPAVAMRNNGDFVVTWTSKGQDGSGWGIYAQRYSALGLPLGLEFRVNSTTANDQLTPAVGIDVSGQIVFAWSSFGQDALGSWGIYSQIYNNLGIALGQETRVNTTTAGDQVNPIIAVSTNFSTISAVNFNIGWSSFNQDSAGSWGAYAARFTPAGAVNRSEYLLNTTTVGNQILSGGAIDSAGNFIPVWTSTGQDGSLGGIYAAKISNAGVFTSKEFRVNTTTAGDQSNPTVTADRYGNFTVIWQSAGQDGSGLGIYGQQFTSSLTNIDGEFKVNSTTLNDQSNPSAKSDSAGHLVVAWNGYTANGYDAIYLQRYSVNTASELPPEGDIFEVKKSHASSVRKTETTEWFCLSAPNSNQFQSAQFSPFEFVIRKKDDAESSDESDSTSSIPVNMEDRFASTEYLSFVHSADFSDRPSFVDLSEVSIFESPCHGVF